MQTLSGVLGISDIERLEERGFTVDEYPLISRIKRMVEEAIDAYSVFLSSNRYEENLCRQLDCKYNLDGK